MVRTYKFYAAVTATASAAAQIDIKRNGKILGIQWCITPNVAGAATDYIVAELSFYPTQQTQVNDPMGIIGMASAAATLATSGISSASVSHNMVYGMETKVGDRVYLHALEAGTNTWQIDAVLYVAE